MFENVSYTDEQVALEREVRRFVADNAARLLECTQRSEFPAELYEEGAGRFGPAQIIPPEYGGLGNGVMEYGIVSEYLGIYQTPYQLSRSIVKKGTDEQKEEYLPRLASGELKAAVSISEPGAGSSLKDLGTTAVPDGDEFVLDGEKTHVNIGAEAGIHVVYADVPGDGLTVFLVEADNPGMRITAELDPIGTRTKPVVDVAFEECRVHRDDLLGEVGGGYSVFFSTFNFSRIGNASSLVGLGRKSMDEAVAYASRRQVDDENAVTDFQGIRWKIADNFTRLRAATKLRDEAAALLEGDADTYTVALATSMAKLMAITAGEEATRDAIQITGGHGLYFDQPFAYYFLNAKTKAVAGGSAEILRNVIADEILKSYEGDEASGEDDPDEDGPGEDGPGEAASH